MLAVCPYPPPPPLLVGMRGKGVEEGGLLQEVGEGVVPHS